MVTALVVDPAARGQGVGERLVAGFVEQAARGPAHRAELITLAGDRGAGGFYEGLGWTVVGTRANRDGQRCLRMELVLPPAATTAEEAVGQAPGTLTG